MWLPFWPGLSNRKQAFLKVISKFTGNFSCVMKSILWEHQSSSKSGFDIEKWHITQIHHLPQEPHSHGLTVATSEILHYGHFKLCMCGQKRNKQTPDFSCCQHCHLRLKWHFSYFSMNFQCWLSSPSGISKERRPSFWAVAEATWLTRRTLIVLVNADSLLNCLILKAARKNTVLLCLSLAQKKNK